MKSTGDRLGRREEAKGGDLWGWIESKKENTCFFYMGGSTTVTSEHLHAEMVCRRTRLQ